MSITISMLAALLQWTLVSLHGWRLSRIEPTPASLTIIRNHIVYPLCIVFTLHGRGMHLLFKVIWTRSMGNISLDGDHLPPRRVKCGIGGGASSSMLSSFKRKILEVKRNPKIMAFIRKRGIYFILGLVSVIHIFTAISIHLSIHGFRWSSSTLSRPIHTFACNGFWLTYGGIIYSILIYSLLVWPITLYYTINLKDAYFFRRDLKVGVGFAITFYFLYFIIRFYSFLEPLRNEMSAFMIMLFGWTALHTFTVTIPLLRSVKWNADGEQPCSRCTALVDHKCTTKVAPCDILGYLDGHSIIMLHRPIPLETVLSNPHLAGPFEVYSRNAFVWDSLLFHRAVITFRSHFPHPRSPTEAHHIYHQYIIEGAPCEMNLSHPLVESIRNRIDMAFLSSDMFDEAQSQVLDLIGNCSYRNFIYTLPPEDKPRYLIPLNCKLIPTADAHVASSDIP